MMEHWQKVKEILQTALYLSSDECGRFLDKVCGGDEPLRREVENLLDSSKNVGDFMEESAIGKVAEMFVGTEENKLQMAEFLNHYRILSNLGAGGMGEVYLAEDTKLNRFVALKLLPQSKSADEGANRRLIREAHTAAALDHQHICQIYEIAEYEGRSFIVMQFCEGETLAEKLGKGVPELRETLDLAIQIADALANAHSHRIIHLDIKPANIIVNRYGQSKILDFGLAKIIAEQRKVESEAKTARMLSAENDIIGTAPYMSPEQMRGKPLDARTDIFSFGAMLYEMLSGEQVFKRESQADTIAAVLHYEPPIEETLADTPLKLQSVVRKSLAKNREERYQTAKDLLLDLHNVKQELDFQNKSERAANPQSEIKTRILAADETDDERQIPVTARTNVKNRQLSFIIGSIILLLAIVILGSWFFANRSAKTIESSLADTPQPASELYWQMTESEQLLFIRERARHIETLIGGEPTEFDEEALRAIKTEIDKYVEQKDSLSQKPFGEGLRVIYGRASQYAPLIIRAYEARQVAPALGIYQAMIESEYHDCLVNQIGSIGLFQFAPKTAEKYGLTLKDYCNVEKQSDAAARYMSDLSSDFNNGNSSATLGLLGFVIGENRVRDYLRQLRGRGIAERSFWTIFRHRQDLQPPLSDDGKSYIPHFFAAAVIGETPEAFELSTPPLTTLREKGK